MITPVLITSIGWGTYLFFAVLNALFIPAIYFFYPETSGRSLEEIDLIFAKGYVENKSYVLAAEELPMLDDSEIDRVARELGLDRGDEETGSSDGSVKEKRRTDEGVVPSKEAQV
jgi:hypothetical protein